MPPRDASCMPSPPQAPGFHGSRVPDSEHRDTDRQHPDNRCKAQAAKWAKGTFLFTHPTQTGRKQVVSKGWGQALPQKLPCHRPHMAVVGQKHVVEAKMVLWCSTSQKCKLEELQIKKQRPCETFMEGKTKGALQIPAGSCTVPLSPWPNSTCKYANHQKSSCISIMCILQ